MTTTPEPRALTHAEKILIAKALAKLEGDRIRPRNAARAKTKEKEIMSEAWETYPAEKYVSTNKSKGRGAHYRFPDGSMLGAEFVDV